MSHVVARLIRVLQLVIAGSVPGQESSLARSWLIQIGPPVWVSSKLLSQAKGCEMCLSRSSKMVVSLLLRGVLIILASRMVGQMLLSSHRYVEDASIDLDAFEAD